MSEARASDGTPAIGTNKMDTVIAFSDLIIRIFLLALIIWCSAILAAIFWVVYIYNKEDRKDVRDGNENQSDKPLR